MFYETNTDFAKLRFEAFNILVKTCFMKQTDRFAKLRFKAFNILIKNVFMKQMIEIPF